MTRKELVDRLIASSTLFQPDTGIDEQTLAIRAAEAIERVKAHDGYFLTEREQTSISDALARSMGLPTSSEGIPE